MSEGITENRAKLDGSADTVKQVFNSRTLESSHRILSDLLERGQSVLDAGCGTGAITYGIAQKVGESGCVIGIDNNEDLVLYARETFGDLSALNFEVADIRTLPYCGEFDVVTSARVLQWLATPEDAIAQMINAVKSGGRVVVLDYNHNKVSWKPDVPPSMKTFYQAFLRWRLDAGMNNAIADELSLLFANKGLIDIKATEQHETISRGEPSFQEQITIWAEVAATRGVQMVADGYLTEHERITAENEYREWAQTKAESQTMYMLAVEGTKP
ncbi:methyltransferase domain-containing protein [Paenibacillus taichungensis]|uniref:methyltransferase domain-containing protein n=1 Tax=Paenibacillus taichungensis TaxID=484184 RepID=UPI002DBEB371|nr:methyltransferase domain-containing protein [Paenibacillus taichungensis]MEC0106296.1 methyltransferase domain-containing protein [Paenibacillus taichungensis]MEC0200198.1 methyltransferase domain-containing protein [Paenibacillus taichungensis]